MPNVPRRSLAEAYAAWVDLRDVTIADISRASRLSRHAIENVRDGGRHQVTLRTLERLAFGIVRGSSGSRRYDEIIMADCYRDLAQAAGYGDPTIDPESSLLYLAMYYQFHSPRLAHRWTAIMERFDAMDPDRAWEALEAAESR
ncbi:MAG TPA: hypothetical protein VNG35_07140 [Gemmatimonadales bacterium]|nr:hypothetical protein [Gemmatimonadales bacterium]